jgi:hypothetical protein
MLIVERDENLIALRLDDGEDIIPGLYEALGDTTSAVLISAVGMLRDFEIGWLGPDGYEKKRFHEAREILSLSGTVNRRDDGKAFIHAHASLAGRNHTVIGGHLFGGTVNFTCELVFMMTEGLVFERKAVVEGEPLKFFPKKK